MMKWLPAVLFLAWNAWAQPATRPPNFVVVLADDLGYGDAGSHGDPRIRTPHLERMASEGADLTSFYAFPTCTPARAALLTGRYPIRSGLIRVLHPGERFGLPEPEITLAEALKDRSYATACIGKWHLGGRPRYRPNRHGFDYYFGLLYSNDMTLLPPTLRRLRLYRNEQSIESPVNQSTLTQRYTAESIEFIRQNRAKPFFLYLAHSMPHFPPHASEAFRGKSEQGIYGDAVEEIDWSVGRILETLRELGLDENTLVIFTSDNGPALGKPRRGGSAGPLRGGKHTTWEGGVRVPFLARWPGRTPGGRRDDGIATIMDIYPTLIELAGGEVPRDRVVDGKNIMTLLEGKGHSPHSSFVYYRGRRIFAVRSGEWKLHFIKVNTGPKGGPGKVQRCNPPELYNLAQDLSEQHDVAAEHPDVVARLTALAKEFEENTEPGKLPSRRRLPGVIP